MNIKISEMQLRSTHSFIWVVSLSIVLIASPAYETFEGAGDVFSGWADSLSEAVTSVNPLAPR